MPVLSRPDGCRLSYEPEHVVDDLAAARSRMQRRNAERRQWDAMQGFEADGRLGGLQMPTLILQGELNLVRRHT